MPFSFFLIDTCPAINPFIYFIFNENYRKGFRKFFLSVFEQRFCCRNPNSLAAIEGNTDVVKRHGASNAVVILKLQSLEK